MTIPRTPDGEPQRRINVELLDRIEQQITEHPETWDQGMWFVLPTANMRTSVIDPPCGTTLCIAGWAVTLSGYKLATAAGVREGGWCVSPGGQREAIDVIARALLGLDFEQAVELFYSGAETSLAEIQAQFAELRELARGGEPR